MIGDGYYKREDVRYHLRHLYADEFHICGQRDDKRQKEYAARKVAGATKPRH